MQAQERINEEINERLERKQQELRRMQTTSPNTSRTRLLDEIIYLKRQLKDG